MVRINIPDVKAYRKKGRPYYYFRPTGKRIVDPVTGEPIDPVTEPAAFAQRVEAMRAAVAVVKPTVGPIKAGTILELVRAWTGEAERPARDGKPAVKGRDASPEWAALRPATRKSYERVVDPETGHIRRALKNGKTLDDLHLDLIDKPWVVKMRNTIAKRAGFWFGNYTVKVLRIAFGWAILYGHMRANPAEGVPELKRPEDLPDQHRPWAQEEYEAMFAGAIERGWESIALAFSLARYGGFAAGDICNQPASVWQDPRLIFVRRKKRKKWVTSFRVPSRLLLDLRTYAPGNNAPALVLNSEGEAYTEDGLRSMVWRLNSDLAKAGKVKMGLTIHGLRHSLGKEMYDLGIEKEARKAMLSHETDAASNIYSRGGDRAAKADQAVIALDRAHSKRNRGGPRT